MASLDVRNMTRRPAPRFPFAVAVSKGLPGWDISLVFVGDAKAKSLNKSLRKKDYIPNVLSYETGVKSGEIIICLPEAKRQAASYEMSYPLFCGYLLIHGIMHLKGYPHGPTMDRYERALLARITSLSSSPHGTTNRRRNRHRDLSDESRRRRRAI